MIKRCRSNIQNRLLLPKAHCCLETTRKWVMEGGKCFQCSRTKDRPVGASILVLVLTLDMMGHGSRSRCSKWRRGAHKMESMKWCHR